jgi:iron complex transport system substrate-binding protein
MVVVPDHPHRLVCLSPSVADAVFALGAGNDVIAISEYTKYPPEALRKPSIGAPLNPSLETIVTLHPDLAIGSADVPPANLTGFERLGIPVFMVKPTGIVGVYSSIIALGKALDREAAAENLVTRLSSRVEAVQARARGKERIPVLVLIWPQPVITIGKDAFITDLISAAGGESITKNLTRAFPEISLESLVALAPESIVLIRSSGMSSASFDDLAHRVGWNGLPAIRNHRIFYTDDRLNSPSPVAIDAMEDLAKQFHP